MIINSEEFTALLPFLILISTVILVMLSIAYRRNHCFVAVSSTLGLLCSFFSLFLVNTVLPRHITTLFYVTKYSIFYMGIVLLSSIISCIFAYSWLYKYRLNKEEFYLLILFSTLGAIGLIISDHFSSLFVSIELISLPIFGLIFYSHYYKYALEATLKYIILSSVSSSFLLLGIAWIYAISGSLSLSAMHQVLNIEFLNSQFVIFFGLFMVFFSLFFKLSIVPFHIWIADIYQGTPALVLSFFSNAAKISIVVFMVHFFSYCSLENHETLYALIFLMIFLSIILGNLMAIIQNNIKRLFGYTAISQLGYLLIALLVLKNHYFFSLEAIGIGLVSYFFANISFFGSIALVSNPNYLKDIDLMTSYRGLFWTQPILSGILTIVYLSLAGVPFTLGFISKFYILSIIIQNHLWVLGVSFFIGSVLGFYCYLRLIINFYLKPVKLLQNNIKLSSKWMYTFSGIIIIISGIILLILGIYPNPLIYLVQSAVYV
ncbi:NADH-quinone oxidoreductase subunit N [Buchnera aphidicola]|uniref:NADH-quinone oxidoreductase subunit N n=1 Tax=Buchnera aphidicola TaxID=9 RepID=UPI003464A45C